MGEKKGWGQRFVKIRKVKMALAACLFFAMFLHPMDEIVFAEEALAAEQPVDTLIKVTRDNFRTEKALVGYDKAVAVIRALVTEQMSDYEKEKAIHDYLATHVTLDKEAEKGNVADPDYLTAYGPLIKGRASSMGYAKAMAFCMNLLGINAQVYSSGSHHWNIIQLDGEWYHVDTACDAAKETGGIPSYRYFNVSDSFLKTAPNHPLRGDAGYPVCIAEKYYYYKNMMEGIQKSPILTDANEASKLIDSGKPFLLFSKTELEKYYTYKQWPKQDTRALTYLMERANTEGVPVYFLDMYAVFGKNATAKMTTFGQFYNSCLYQHKGDSDKLLYSFYAPLWGGAQFGISEKNFEKELPAFFEKLAEAKSL